MSPRIDWLSRLLDMVPVRGHLDLRCFYGAPWRIEGDRAKPGEIPYHVVLGGSAVLEDVTGGTQKRLAPGDSCCSSTAGCTPCMTAAAPRRLRRTSARV
jgi:AraC family transcriptional regulator, activator of mtrCDE